jgi:hypothetical protein
MACGKVSMLFNVDEDWGHYFGSNGHSTSRHDDQTTDKTLCVVRPLLNKSFHVQ